MSSKTLILTRDFAPHKVVSEERALLMLFQGKIRVVEEYMSDEHVVGVLEPSRLCDFKQVVKALGNRAQPGSGLVIRIPSVASLLNPVGTVKRGVKFSRINVFTRDGFRCQYCGESKKITELNYDHVVPRQQGGRTIWENIVTSCYSCNSRKANRTPEQAGMRLVRKPYKPKTLPMTGPRFDFHELPAHWLPYVVSMMGEEAAARACVA
jgi:5-methylcytosine-specific restriction endonuclease McrA